MAMDSSPSPRVVKQYHQVFLSFRGEDTRRTIVGHLYKALRDRGIDTFKDNKRFEIGESISDEIKDAIQNSKIAVVVISENYASSTWCLNELQMIMELHKKQQLIAVPILYDVDPSDVRHQRRRFSLNRYKSAIKFLLFPGEKTKVLKWREALTDISRISGKVSKTCESEAMMVDDIARRISQQLFAVEPIDMVDIVGMKAHMERLNFLLDMDSTTDEVRMIGIWGMGGVGKTTIAKFLYKEYSHGFAPHHCFIENVRSSASTGNGHLLDLQEKLLSSVVGEEHEKLWSVEQGCSLIKSRLGNRKVFLVVDDIDDLDQLHALAKERSWFGPGSRIIVTTRDKGLFNSSEVRFVYHVDVLEHDDSMQVLKQFAFEGGEAPSDVHQRLAIHASSLAQGLPSALEVFGTYLRRITSIDKWEEALGRLRKIPHQRIMEIFKNSYMGLDRKHKDVFLHVACLFNGDSVQSVKALLDDGGLEIKALAEKSLIDISADGYITMHVLVEQAGKEFVREESDSRPMNQEILWEPKQIVSVLQNNIRPSSMQSVALHMCEMRQVSYMVGRVFLRSRLRFLKVFRHVNHTKSNLQFVQGTEKLPETLVLLHWDCYPLATLPPTSYLSDIIELNLRHSNLERLWDQNMRLDTLRRLDVTCSSNLRETPDLSRATKLEELLMEGCTSLKTLPGSIGSLSGLKKLNLSNCDGLANLQIQISDKLVPLERYMQRRQIILHFHGAEQELNSLADLSIEGRINIEFKELRGDAEHISCISKQPIPYDSKLVEFYDFKSLNIKRIRYNKDGAPFRCYSFSDFPYLAELKLINLNMLHLPDDISRLHSLEKLDLSGNDFKNLPTYMNKLSKLKYFRLSNCIKLEALPELTQLQTLKVCGCSNLRSLLELSPTIHERVRYGLLELGLDNCKIVESLSDQLRHFTSLIHLDLSEHDFEAIPESIRELLSLGTLCLNNCKKLKSVEELPQSLKHLYAHGCNSLENVALSRDHSIKHLDLSHCFSLQQAEQLITLFLNGGYSREVSQRFACLPGTRAPKYFDNRSHGTSTKISLPPIRSTSTVLGFTACIKISCQSSFYLQFPAFSYDWNCDADEVIRINLKPNLYRSSEIEKEETVPSHHLVIINVPSSINTEKNQELRLESHLQFSEEFQFPPAEINTSSIRMIADG